MPPPAELRLPIETERLRLRDFRLEDAPAVHAYGADPEVTHYMPWGPNTPEETAAFIARALEQQATWPRLDLGLAIEHRGLGVVVGSIALHLRDIPHRSLEMGYCLRRDLWGQGLVTEAGRALLRVGFEELGLHRITATCDVRNTGSYRVMERLGMRREGEMRKDRRVRGAWRDTYLYAILAESWSPSPP